MPPRWKVSSPEAKKSSGHWFRSCWLENVFVGRGLEFKYVAQRQEQAMVGKRKVCAVLWAGLHSTDHVKHLLPGEVCNVGYCIVVKEREGAVVRAPALNLTGQTIHLLAVKLGSDAVVGWEQLKLEAVLSVPTDWHHDTSRTKPRLGCDFQVCTRWCITTACAELNFGKTEPPFCFRWQWILAKNYVWRAAAKRLAWHGFGAAPWSASVVGYPVQQLDTKPCALRCSTTVDSDNSRAAASLHAVCWGSSLTSWHRRSSLSPDGWLDRGRFPTSLSPVRKSAIQFFARQIETAFSQNILLTWQVS